MKPSHQLGFQGEREPPTLDWVTPVLSWGMSCQQRVLTNVRTLCEGFVTFIRSVSKAKAPVLSQAGTEVPKMDLGGDIKSLPSQGFNSAGCDRHATQEWSSRMKGARSGSERRCTSRRAAEGGGSRRTGFGQRLEAVGTGAPWLTRIPKPGRGKREDTGLGWAAGEGQGGWGPGRSACTDPGGRWGPRREAKQTGKAAQDLVGLGRGLRLCSECDGSVRDPCTRMTRSLHFTTRFWALYGESMAAGHGRKQVLP